MDQELKQQAEELEQTLQKQLELFKEDSQIYLKVGGMALLGGLLAVGSVRLLSSRGSKSVKNGKQEKKKAKKKKGYSFFRTIGNRLLWMAFDYGKARLVERLIANVAKADTDESEE
ncbi:hypothetical protein [Cyclobacterium xiamenense]|jgi:hypothetical protein|uniref:hypothetical protein n=1 Tax=Cyclobacterium xiamenense TaxID=1297121 RepID=UPI0035D0E280